jgi:hypothetical protein
MLHARINRADGLAILPFSPADGLAILRPLGARARASRGPGSPCHASASNAGPEDRAGRARAVPPPARGRPGQQGTPAERGGVLAGGPEDSRQRMAETQIDRGEIERPDADMHAPTASLDGCLDLNQVGLIPRVHEGSPGICTPPPPPFAGPGPARHIFPHIRGTVGGDHANPTNAGTATARHDRLLWALNRRGPALHGQAVQKPGQCLAEPGVGRRRTLLRRCVVVAAFGGCPALSRAPRWRFGSGAPSLSPPTCGEEEGERKHGVRWKPPTHLLEVSGTGVHFFRRLRECCQR